MTPVSDGGLAHCLVELIVTLFVTRSRGPLARNPPRDVQVDGERRVYQAPDLESHRRLFLDAVGHRSHASQNPPKFLARKESQ